MLPENDGVVDMLGLIRLVGIAIGSLVAAVLVMWLVGWILGPLFAPFAGLATLILGGLIYNDIRRRDRPNATRG
jgi:CHASE2 domain-containing sensor protein